MTAAPTITIAEVQSMRRTSDLPLASGNNGHTTLKDPLRDDLSRDARAVVRGGGWVPRRPFPLAGSLPQIRPRFSMAWIPFSPLTVWVTRKSTASEQSW